MINNFEELYADFLPLVNLDMYKEPLEVVLDSLTETIKRCQDREHTKLGLLNNYKEFEDIRIYYDTLDMVRKIARKMRKGLYKSYKRKLKKDLLSAAYCFDLLKQGKQFEDLEKYLEVEILQMSHVVYEFIYFCIKKNRFTDMVIGKERRMDEMDDCLKGTFMEKLLKFVDA